MIARMAEHRGWRPPINDRLPALETATVASREGSFDEVIRLAARLVPIPNLEGHPVYGGYPALMQLHGRLTEHNRGPISHDAFVLPTLAELTEIGQRAPNRFRLQINEGVYEVMESISRMPPEEYRRIVKTDDALIANLIIEGYASFQGKRYRDRHVRSAMRDAAHELIRKTQSPLYFDLHPRSKRARPQRSPAA